MAGSMRMQPLMVPGIKNSRQAPKRVTPLRDTDDEPSEKHNCETKKNDLIVYEGDILSSAPNQYEIVQHLGQGTFGNVYLARIVGREEEVALKIVKNQPAYTRQALLEIQMLKHVNEHVDPFDQHRLVRLIDWFKWGHCCKQSAGQQREYICLVFERLQCSLFDLLRSHYNSWAIQEENLRRREAEIKEGLWAESPAEMRKPPAMSRPSTQEEIRWSCRGFSLEFVRRITLQMIEALILLSEHCIIHCDLKPENVLVTKANMTMIKLIDFGSACVESEIIYEYIQSRFYRAPEVILRDTYTTAIDMWSMACVAAEIFLGTPLFPATNQYDLLSDIVTALGPLPDKLLKSAKLTDQFYSKEGKHFRMRSFEEWADRVDPRPSTQGQSFKRGQKLAAIIFSHSYDEETASSDENLKKEQDARESFADFLTGILDPNPETRWTPKQAMQHPFILQIPMKEIWAPPPDDIIPLPPGFIRRGETKPPPRASQAAQLNVGSQIPLAGQSAQAIPNLPLSPEEYAHKVAMAAAQATFQHFSPSTQYNLNGGPLQGYTPSQANGYNANLMGPSANYADPNQLAQSYQYHSPQSIGQPGALGQAASQTAGYTALGQQLYYGAANLMGQSMGYGVPGGLSPLGQGMNRTAQSLALQRNFPADASQISPGYQPMAMTPADLSNSSQSGLLAEASADSRRYQGQMAFSRGNYTPLSTCDEDQPSHSLPRDYSFSSLQQDPSGVPIPGIGELESQPYPAPHQSMHIRGLRSGGDDLRMAGDPSGVSLAGSVNNGTSYYDPSTSVRAAMNFYSHQGGMPANQAMGSLEAMRQGRIPHNSYRQSGFMYQSPNNPSLPSSMTRYGFSSRSHEPGPPLLGRSSYQGQNDSSHHNRSISRRQSQELPPLHGSTVARMRKSASKGSIESMRTNLDPQEILYARLHSEHAAQTSQDLPSMMSPRAPDHSFSATRPIMQASQALSRDSQLGMTDLGLEQSQQRGRSRDVYPYTTGLSQRPIAEECQYPSQGQERDSTRPAQYSQQHSGGTLGPTEPIGFKQQQEIALRMLDPSQHRQAQQRQRNSGLPIPHPVPQHTWVTMSNRDRASSGASELFASPGEWDPYYSDAQLLEGEEQLGRKSGESSKRNWPIGKTQ